MKLLACLITGSLRSSNQFNQISHLNKLNQINRYCTAQTSQIAEDIQKKKIVIVNGFSKILKKDEQLRAIKAILLQCNTSECDWKYKATQKMVKVYSNLDHEFENLDKDKLDLLLNDCDHLKNKKLFAPKVLTDEMLNDLNKLWNDDKHRIHFLGIIFQLCEDKVD